MFGFQYANYVDTILNEMGGMTEDYKKRAKVSPIRFIKYLQKIYIYIFGIPEIGFQVRALYFKDMLKKLQVKDMDTILDAGSGIGAYTCYLGAFFPRAFVDGLEIDREKVKFCERFVKEQYKTSNVHFFYGNLEKDKLKENTYNLIISVDVLEHVNYPVEVLQKFYKALKPKGFLYIHVPQIDQKRFFKSMVSWHHEDHVREGFSPDDLVKEFESIGFRVVYTKNTFGFFGSLAWELNHIFIYKSFVMAGLLYPFLYLLAKCDLFINNRNGLGIAVLVSK